MEGFLGGFSLAPKPLRGVEVFVVEHSLSTQLPIKEVLQKFCTPAGLTSWLGQSSDFVCHVGIKFNVAVDGEESKAVFTRVDVPRVIVFMVEALGEFEFNLSQSPDKVSVSVKVRRALAPEVAPAWTENVNQLISALESVMSRG
jgi:hypothetical protein